MEEPVLSSMPAPPVIARFTEDELARAPQVFDQVLLALITRLTRPAPTDPPDQRLRAGELALALAPLRNRMVADFSASLTMRAQQELQRATTSAPAPAPATTRAQTAKLALVDENAVAADVETARAADTIKAVTEHEIRELAAFLSALAGDALVVQHHFVLHPEHQARALWDAAKLLPDEKDLRAHFMRQVASPWAAELRRQWSAACGRLEDAGIVPAAYKTMILHAGMRVDPAQTAPAGPSLDGVARALELIGRRLAAQPAPEHASSYAAARASGPSSYAAVDADIPVDCAPEPAPLRADPRIATIGRIFDAFETEPRIEPDLRPAIARLRMAALKAAASDPALGVTDQHALWTLIDRIAWQGQTLPAPPNRERLRTAQVIMGLADQLAKEAASDASRFQWAIERIAALEKNRFERQVSKHDAQIAALEALDHELVGGASGSQGVVRRTDFGDLPTVPANLYDAGPAPTAELPTADAWLDSVAPGGIARLLIQGQWVMAQLQWKSASGELWLWADCTSDELWPVRRGALCMLFQGGLAGPVSPGGVVRDLVRELGARAARASSY
jgi:Protein of unknown function (DUF1631)